MYKNFTNCVYCIKYFPYQTICLKCYCIWMCVCVCGGRSAKDKSMKEEEREEEEDNIISLLRLTQQG